MPRAVLLLGVFLSTVPSRAGERLEFNRDVRPILSDNCFFCHGPDAEQRQAGLRLDLREDALAAAAFLPGVPDESLLVQRILSEDLDELMPPPDSHKKLTSSQKEVLQRWIAEGAEYQRHWAFVPPIKPDLPLESPFGANTQNPIDNFIWAKLGENNLAPSPSASKETLIRRVTLDLTGLPPTPEEVDAFLHDSAADAYERVVDRLLASPHFGERMAVDWLDAARYADTNGYQVDRDRELWPWRDWVIRAFNDNMPFDRFTVEQIAGDLLPNATLAQRIATGFHRNHMLNEEGGILEDEFLAEYTADRVETTAAVWLGQTFNCARCHDHKFDPFTQRDFYAMKAFFHNVPERGVGDYSSPIRRNSPPFLRLPAPEIESRIAELQSKLPDSENPSPDLTEEEVESLKKQIAAAELEIPTTLIMEEMNEPRSTYVLLRGAYDRLGDVVTAATPAVLPELDDNMPRNRLGLAQWLVSPENPLTARVTVNRLWQQIFGTGLVRTSEDFGSQGELPSHPELLDWLAVTFRDRGWNVKDLLRLLVTSATYQQQSHLSPMLLELDPDNRLIARGPRQRLMGEFVRDQALAASGLLIRELGGPSVKPYHPPGLYEQVTSGSGYNVYVAGQGDELRRRSLYTYWKRSVPHPAMLLFDAPFRETCTLRRPTSNSPLQALNLLNDPTYIEAARFLAARMMREGGSSIDSRLTHGFRLLLARPPRPHELEVLRAAFDRVHRDFENDPEAAIAFLTVGDMGRAPELDTVELASYSLVATTLMNLDETVMKE